MKFTCIQQNKLNIAECKDCSITTVQKIYKGSFSFKLKSDLGGDQKLFKR